MSNYQQPTITPIPPMQTPRYPESDTSPDGDLYTPSGSTNTKQRRTRTRTGCLTCRLRKVKCDERPDECANCEKLGAVCRWPSKVEITQTQAPTTSSLRVRSCESCRSSRTRCTRERPRCGRCASLNLSCIYRSVDKSPSSRHRLPRNAGSKLGSDDEIEPSPNEPSLSPKLNDHFASKQELDRLVSLFFSRCQSPTVMFVNQGDMLRSIAEGIASPLLVKAMCTLAGRRLDTCDRHSPDGGRKFAQWAEDVKRGLMKDSDRLNTTRLAAGLLMVEHEWSSGRRASAWTLTGFMTRMALAMGLNNRATDEANSRLPWTFRESRKRLMWSTFCADALASGGKIQFTNCPSYLIDIDLPTSEHAFRVSSPGKSQKLVDVDIMGPGVGILDPTADGLMARHVRLMAIRSDLLSYVRHLNDHSLRPWDPLSPFELCAGRLRHWRDTLPAELEFNLQNMYARSSTGELDALMEIHCWYDQLSSYLYRIVLPGVEESAPQGFFGLAPEGWVDSAQDSCFMRARTVANHCVMLRRHFPAHTPSVWRFELFCLQSIRTQVQYILLRRDTMTEQSINELRPGLQAVMEVLAMMMRSYTFVRPTIRHLLRLLKSVNIFVHSDLLDPALLYVTKTPAPEHSTSQVPWMRQYFKGTTMMTDEERTRTEERDKIASSTEQFIDDTPPSGPPRHTVQFASSPNYVQTALEPFTSDEDLFEMLFGDSHVASSANDYLSVLPDPMSLDPFSQQPGGLAFGMAMDLQAMDGLQWLKTPAEGQSPAPDLA